ncbi:unnamed protein product [Gordionus sp. m RMFG-2023]|uniref:uncharacterized protein LOC135932090 n=1 Tax=Gordionus sp. m RMFG-2023 TaxID=3053472 RepID=UPI0030DE34C8
MCYVIITLRTVIWCLFSLFDTVLMIVILMSPMWLVGIQNYNRLIERVPIYSNYTSAVNYLAIIRNNGRYNETGINKKISRNHRIKRRLADNNWPNIKNRSAKKYSLLFDRRQKISFPYSSGDIVENMDNHVLYIDAAISQKVNVHEPNSALTQNPYNRDQNKSRGNKNYPRIDLSRRSRSKNWNLDNMNGQLPTLFHEYQRRGKHLYLPSIGIYTRCTKLYKAWTVDNPKVVYRTSKYTGSTQKTESEKTNNEITYFCGPFETFPSNIAWKIVLIFMLIGCILMIITCFAALVSFCIRSLFKKSICILTGIVQAFAGLFFTLALIIYPIGWSSSRVEKICGNGSDIYALGHCEPGWAFYSGIGGTVLCFLCSFLTIQAEISTSNDKVQSEILKGRSIIFLL